MSWKVNFLLFYLFRQGIGGKETIHCFRLVLTEHSVTLSRYAFSLHVFLPGRHYTLASLFKNLMRGTKASNFRGSSHEKRIECRRQGRQQNVLRNSRHTVQGLWTKGHMLAKQGTDRRPELVGLSREQNILCTLAEHAEGSRSGTSGPSQTSQCSP